MDNETCIWVTGDFVPGGEIGEQVNPLKELKENCSPADYFWVNLECGFRYNHKPIKNNSSKVYGDLEKIFQWVGTSKKFLFSSANNHAGDYGVKSIRETINNFAHHQIPLFGINKAEGKKYDWFEIENDNVKIALLAVTSDRKNVGDHLQGDLKKNISVYSERFLTEIAQKKLIFDYVLVSFHFGKEFVHIPIPEDRVIAKKMIDHGADIVIGHHAHVIQGYEVYKNKYIYYGLGNTFFPEFRDPQPLKWDKNQRTGFLLNITFSGSINSSVVPIFLDKKNKINFLVGKSKERAIRKIKKISEPLALISTQYEVIFEKQLRWMLVRKIIAGVFKKRLFINKKNLKKLRRLYLQLMRGGDYFRKQNEK